LIHWARFFRVPLLPTVWCHLFAAALLVDKSILDYPWLIVAFSMVYLYGMADNDRADLPRDLEKNPGRPLASGAISLTAAQGAIMLILTLGAVSVYLNRDPHQSLMVAVSLVAAIAYNRKLKHYVLPGALCMGVARGSIYYSFMVPIEAVLILAFYTVFVTLWSTTEEKHPARKKFTLIFLLLLPWLDFAVLFFNHKHSQYAVFLLAMPIVCRLLVLSLMPRKSN
jgi:4-hydroxybenzoate polyprenyltransferase